jgi:hypothetical protein
VGIPKTEGLIGWPRCMVKESWLAEHALHKLTHHRLCLDVQEVLPEEHFIQPPDRPIRWMMLVSTCAQSKAMAHSCGMHRPGQDIFGEEAVGGADNGCTEVEHVSNVRRADMLAHYFWLKK